MFIAGLVVGLLGALLTFNPRFARWSLTMGRAQIWNKLLGPERALKLTRLFFGPLMLLLAVISILGSFVALPPSH